MPSSADRRRPFWWLVASTLILDRITKVIAERELLAAPINVLGEVVRFRLAYNPGAAFGLGATFGSASRWIFGVIALVAAWLLWKMSREAPATDRLRQYAVGFIAGGALGNLIDRLLSSRGVIDFIDVGLRAGAWRWPTFNVADMAVSCGAVALAISLWHEDTARRRETSG